MHVRGMGGEVGIPRGDRRGDQPVLGDGRGEPLGDVAREAPHAHEVGADGAQGGAEVVVADRGVQLRIEAGDERVVGVAPLVAVEGARTGGRGELVGERGERARRLRARPPVARRSLRARGAPRTGRGCRRRRRRSRPSRAATAARRVRRRRACRALRAAACGSRRDVPPARPRREPCPAPGRRTGSARGASRRRDRLPAWLRLLVVRLALIVYTKDRSSRDIRGESRHLRIHSRPRRRRATRYSQICETGVPLPRMTTVIRTNGLTKHYGHVHALDGLDLERRGRSGARLPRSERRRQVHDDPHPPRPGPRDRR